MFPEAFMSTKANVRHVGDVAIVDLAGRITLGEGSGMLRGAIKDLVASGQKNILLNLEQVTYLDSAGLGEMVGSYASITNAKGTVRLLHPQAKVHDLLQITKLYTVFQAFDDEAEALRSFAAAAASSS
jgi:anti-sigma B factor antagonist